MWFIPCKSFQGASLLLFVCLDEEVVWEAAREGLVQGWIYPRSYVVSWGLSSLSNFGGSCEDITLVRWNRFLKWCPQRNSIDFLMFPVFASLTYISFLRQVDWKGVSWFHLKFIFLEILFIFIYSFFIHLEKSRSLAKMCIFIRASQEPQSQLSLLGPYAWRSLSNRGAVLPRLEESQGPGVSSMWGPRRMSRGPSLACLGECAKSMVTRIFQLFCLSGQSSTKHLQNMVTRNQH